MIRNTSLGGTDWESPSRIKPVDLNDTFDEVADRIETTTTSKDKIAGQLFKNQLQTICNADLIGINAKMNLSAGNLNLKNTYFNSGKTDTATTKTGFTYDSVNKLWYSDTVTSPLILEFNDSSLETIDNAIMCANFVLCSEINSVEYTQAFESPQVYTLKKTFTVNGKVVFGEDEIKKVDFAKANSKWKFIYSDGSYSEVINTTASTSYVLQKYTNPHPNRKVATIEIYLSGYSSGSGSPAGVAYERNAKVYSDSSDYATIQYSMSTDGTNWVNCNDSEICDLPSGSDIYRKITITRTDNNYSAYVSQEGVFYNVR